MFSVPQGRAHAGSGRNGRRVRDWTDVRDVARLLTKIGELSQQETFRSISGGSGRGTRVACLVGKPIKNWDNGIAVRYSGTVRAEDPFSLLADDTTFRRLAFDWRIPVGWGVADHVSWFKDQIR